MVIDSTKKLEEATLDWKVVVDIKDDDKKALAHVQERFEAMRDARSEYEAFWDFIDKELKAKPRAKWWWRIAPNLKMEEALIEASVWMQDTSLPITVEADWKPDWKQMALAKYTLDHFIYKESIVEEFKLSMDYSRARYGTAILFSWMELSSKYVASETQESDYFNPKGKVERIEELHVKIKDIPIRNAYFDNTATKYRDCVDCIYEEWLSVDEYKLRYLNDNGKSKDNFTNAEFVGVFDGNEEKWPDKTKATPKNMVKLWHYFNKLYAKYIIVANESVVIYNWLASTRHGELPLIPVQFYNNPFWIYGIGIPERYMIIKWLNKNFYEAMVWGAWLNAGTALILWEWADVDGWIFLEPGEVNLIQMTKGSARDVTPYNANVNVQQLVEIVQFMDDIWSYLTGVNIKAPYTSPAKTAFEASVMKEEQNNRLKTIYDTRVIWIEKAFTLMLSNIFTFLPYQYAERMIDEQEKLWNFEWYQIPIKWHKIYRDDNWNIVNIEPVADQWYAEYFDLKPDIIAGARGMKVRIVTTQTASTMKALEIENLMRYLQAKAQVMQFKAQAMQMWWDTQTWDKIDQRLDVLFNIDKWNIDITSHEEQLREEMAEVTDILNSFSLSQDPNETANQIGMEQAMQPEAIGASWEEGTQTVQAPRNPLWTSVQTSI